MVTNPLVITLLIFFITAAGFLLCRNKFIAKISPALIIIILGAIFSNAEVLPNKSEIYEFITGTVTSLSLIFLLLSFDLSQLRRIQLRLVLIFFLAVAGSSIGGFVGGIIFHDYIDEAWKLSGALTGTYTGGSINFVAIANALKMESSLFTATTAADNVTTALWMGFNLLAPLWLGRFFSKPKDDETSVIEEKKEKTALITQDLIILIAIGLFILVLSTRLYELFDDLSKKLQEFPGTTGPFYRKFIKLIRFFNFKVLWFTTLALLAAQLPWIKKLKGSFELGNLGLHLFFAVIGIYSNFQQVINIGPLVFYFTLTVVAVHGVITYGIAYLLKIDIATVTIASQAAVGGPSTAMAIAMARWPFMALPAMAMGLLGYAIGNYAGFLVAFLVKNFH